MYDSASAGTWKAASWYHNPRVDALLGQARRTVAQAERVPLYQEACRLIVEDAADIWVFDQIEHVPLARTVQGYKFSLVGSGQEFWHMYFDART
jgi:peptide/nickel transport system substrate-binding protein